MLPVNERSDTPHKEIMTKDCNKCVIYYSHCSCQARSMEIVLLVTIDFCINFDQYSAPSKVLDTEEIQF